MTSAARGTAVGGGFVFAQGEFTDFSYQGNTTYQNGINADGVIVGTYYDNKSGEHGFNCNAGAVATTPELGRMLTM